MGRGQTLPTGGDAPHGRLASQQHKGPAGASATAGCRQPQPQHPAPVLGPVHISMESLPTAQNPSRPEVNLKSRPERVRLNNRPEPLTGAPFVSERGRTKSPVTRAAMSPEWPFIRSIPPVPMLDTPTFQSRALHCYRHFPSREAAWRGRLTRHNQQMPQSQPEDLAERTRDTHGHIAFLLDRLINKYCIGPAGI